MYLPTNRKDLDIFTEKCREFIKLYVFKKEASIAFILSVLLYSVAPSNISLNLFKEIMSFISPVLATVFTTYLAIYFAALAVMITAKSTYLKILDDLQPTKTIGAFGALLLCVVIMLCVFLITTLTVETLEGKFSVGPSVVVLFFFIYSVSGACSVMKQIIEVTLKHVRFKQT